jgi:hypothetical protein
MVMQKLLSTIFSTISKEDMEVNVKRKFTIEDSQD